MSPIITADGIDLSPGVILPIIAVVAIVVVVAFVGRTALFEAGDTLADLWRTYGPVAGKRTLAHLPGSSGSPWVCERCKSINRASSGRCYHCDARREEAEAGIEA